MYCGTKAVQSQHLPGQMSTNTYKKGGGTMWHEISMVGTGSTKRSILRGTMYPSLAGMVHIEHDGAL